jgi:hypothetical protein
LRLPRPLHPNHPKRAGGVGGLIGEVGEANGDTIHRNPVKRWKIAVGANGLS